MMWETHLHCIELLNGFAVLFLDEIVASFSLGFLLLIFFSKYSYLPHNSNETC